jgi:hypothetical protein
MRCIAYGFNIRVGGEDFILANQMAQYVGLGLETLADLRSFKPTQHSPEDTVFIFGQAAKRRAGDIKCKNLVEFPDFGNLDMAFGNEEDRKLAFEKLKELKNKLATSSAVEEKKEIQEQPVPSIITEEQLPELTTYDVLQQITKTLEQKKKDWIGKTKEGRTIRLSLDGTVDNKVDINLTFAELYMIRAAMEALQVKELEVVPRYRSVSEIDNESDDPESPQ